LAIALAVNLYKCGMKIEKGHCEDSIEKKNFYNQIDEIEEKISNILDSTIKSD
jgi:hypothetical protein